MARGTLLGRSSVLVLCTGLVAVGVVACQSAGPGKPPGPSQSASSGPSPESNRATDAAPPWSSPAEAIPTGALPGPGVPAGPGSSVRPSPHPPAVTGLSGETSLKISVVDSPGAAARVHLLNCNGTEAAEGSTVRDPGAACAAVTAAEARFFPQPVGAKQNCRAQYAGPAVARVTGHIGSRAVDARFDQTDGCAIDAWNSLSPLFGGRAGHR